LGGKQLSSKANRLNDKEMGVGICPVYCRRGTPNIAVNLLWMLVTHEGNNTKCNYENM